jgi:hypothetical protein
MVSPPFTLDKMQKPFHFKYLEKREFALRN